MLQLLIRLNYISRTGHLSANTPKIVYPTFQVATSCPDQRRKHQVCIVINDTLYASRKEKLIPVIAMPYNEKAIVNTPVSLIRNNKAYTLLSIDKLAQYGLASEESVQQVQPMFPILRH